MEALVHFAVGLSGGLLLLLHLDLPPARAFIAMFASAAWAMIPDGHWMLHETGATALAATWKRFHDESVLVDLFWFHRVLDRSETGHSELEMGAALAGLFVVVGVYYVANDWAAD